MLQAKRPVPLPADPIGPLYLRAMHCLRHLAFTCSVILLASPWAAAQTDSLSTEESTWWRSLFRAKTVEAVEAAAPAEAATTLPPAPAADTVGNALAPVELPGNEAAVVPATWRLQADARLHALDSAWRAAPQPMEGYRIQLMTGTLQACRRERSLLRGTADHAVYLVPLSLDYQVLLGDFRDSWSAQRERDQWVEAYPGAIVVPGPIALPTLTGGTGSDIAEPSGGLGDE